MPYSQKDLEIRASEIATAFVSAGAERIEAETLLPAETLLDLYGEDIRARAYITQDPHLGELMLRPDFTVPIVRQHMELFAEPARYAYQGRVWRKQAPDQGRANEYLQVGYELFDGSNLAAADAEVFALFASVLPDDLQVITGDVGILHAAVKQLGLSDLRKNALLRHLWRPQRFDDLIQEYSGQRNDELAPRRAMLDAVPVDATNSAIDAAGPEIGLRSKAAVAARLAQQRAQEQENELSEQDAEFIKSLWGMNCTLNEAPDALAKLCQDRASLDPILAGFNNRLSALDAKGLDLTKIQFVGNYGLTAMEYYDGFVFGFSKGGALVATGGRYDALTRQLGMGREIPAVGGIIRPDVLLEIEGGQNA